MSLPHLAIIGGGPAGLFAAWCAARVLTEGSVTLYERNDRCGRKLLATGSGQCNLTREDPAEQMLTHYGEHGRFLVHAMHALDPEHTVRLFRKLGLPLAVREDGKIFPASLKASDVRDVLVRSCLGANVRIVTGSRILTMEKRDGRFFFCDASERTFAADRVLLATGGMTYPKTGSTGDGYRLASQLGHAINAPHPALTAVSVPDSAIGSCSGISLESVALVHTDRDGKRRVANGALLITHDGLSGPLILNHSRYLTTGDVIEICWLPKDDGKPATVQEITGELVRGCNARGSAQLSTIIHELGLPMKLTQFILAEASADGSNKAAQTGKKTLASIARLLACHRFTVSLKDKEAQAMVSAGGVCLDEVDPRTMASRVTEGLWFAGELLDIDGDTGGYNLQAAWSTAAIAGVSMAGGNPFTSIGQLSTFDAY